MVTEVILPQLGDTMNEGTIQAWNKRVGDRVDKGDVLFEVLTDKVSMQVEATTSGYVREIRRQENETAPVGEVIAIITTTMDEPLPSDGDQSPVATRTLGDDRPSATVGQQPLINRPSSVVDVVKVVNDMKRFASPRARRLADEKGVDLSLVTPTGSNGKRIVEADVMRFLEVQEKKAAGLPLTGARRVIAERMSASAQQTASVTLMGEADATALVELRTDLNQLVQDARFTYTDLFILIAAKALLKHPHINRTFDQDGVHQHPSVNVGVAVDTERGLLVPVIRDAHIRDLGDISRSLRQLSEQARAGIISPADIRGSTFTITNLGAYEIDAFTPIINLPETAILGIGQIALKPANYQGQLALRHRVVLSLTFDHRLVDGAPAARFLQDVKRFVEAPNLILV